MELTNILNFSRGNSTINRYAGRAMAVITAITIATPVFYVLATAAKVDTVIWQRLFSTRIPQLLFNSLSLTFVVAIGAVILGGTLAFLTERTEMPFKRILKPLFIAPLITPCYIIAICYINFFGINGLGERIFVAIGLPIRLPNIYGFWGAATMLILGTFPYVYIIVAASLHRIDPRFFEAARCLGAGRIKRIFKVGIPLLLPAFSAGAALAALYVLSDFGVVTLLRFKTFVNIIYNQMNSYYNYTSASALSSILIILTMIVLLIQEKATQQKQFAAVQNRIYETPPTKLGVLKWPLFIFGLLIITVSLLIPLGILIYWFAQSLITDSPLTQWGNDFGAIWQSSLNSISLSAVTATVAVGLSLPLSYWSVRQSNSKAGKFITWTAQSGMALPGVLTALGVSLILNKIAPQLTFSVPALFFAFLVHFFAQSLQMTNAGLAQITKDLEDEARVLGAPAFKTFWKITRPLLNPALAAGWVMVFLSCMRELPASLLLRPAGFDPLTVKVWIAASEGFYEQSAAPALMIIVLSLPIVVILSHKGYNK